MNLNELLKMSYDEALDWLIDNQNDYEIVMIDKKSRPDREEDLRKIINKGDKRLQVYCKTINKIDDYFEYRYDSRIDKITVDGFLDAMSKELLKER